MPVFGDSAFDDAGAAAAAGDEELANDSVCLLGHNSAFSSHPVTLRMSPCHLTKQLFNDFDGGAIHQRSDVEPRRHSRACMT